MRQIIESSKLLENEDFLLWFLMTNFPEGTDSSGDNSIAEIIESNSVIDKKIIYDLTGYYDGIFDESDGYIENPHTIELNLSACNYLFIEFYPGDTLYFINDKMIGCTGPDYSIRKITLEEFLKYTPNIKSLERLLLLPMLRVCSEEKNKMFDILYSIFNDMNLKEINKNELFMCIYENCLEQ